MDYFTSALKKFADFNGRARRKEYWMFMLYYLIFLFGFAVIDVIADTSFFTQLFSLALLVPTLSIGARRLHDTSRSGWWQLIGIIPFIGVPILVVLFLLDSHDANDYGMNPKAIED